MFEQTTDQVAPVTPAPAEPNQQVTPASDPYQDLIKDLKTKDGRTKYATVSDALNSIGPKEDHINTLEEELATLRAEVEKRTSVEDALSQLTNNVPEGQTAPSALDEASVVQLVQSVLAQNETQSTAKQNQARVAAALKESFGEEAETTFYAKADELGVSQEFFNDLAAKSPAAVLALVGTKAAVPNTNPSTGTVNTAGFVPTDEKVNTNIMGGASQEDILKVWRSVANP